MAEWLRKNSRYKVVVVFVLLAGLCGRLDDAIAQSASPAAKPGDDPSQQLQKMIEDVFKGASPAAKPDGDQSQQMQKIMEGVLNGILDGTGNQQAPDNSAEIGKLFDEMIQAEGGKGELNRGMACVVPMMIPKFAGQKDENISPEDKAKSDELIAQVSKFAAGGLKRDWENQVEITRKAIELEQEIKQWTLSGPRELYQGALWANHGIALLLQQQGDRGQNIEGAIEALKKGLEIFRQGIASSVLKAECKIMMAEFHGNLGNAYVERIRGERAENFELAIAALEAGLALASRETIPNVWGVLQNSLGVAYRRRIRGKPAENLERAIAAYEAALEVRPRETFPEGWASVQGNLGIAYMERVRGNREENIERAIQAFKDGLDIVTREFPSGEKPVPNPLAELQKENEKNLKGTPFEDFGKSLYETFELLNTIEAKGDRAGIFFAPDNWARFQENLGDAYRKRLKGDRAENIELAIAAYEAALTLWKRDAYPWQWALGHTILGEAYSVRIQGKRADNLDRAIAAYRAALEIRTSEAFPRDNIETARLLGQALNAKGDWQGALKAFDMARTSFRLLFGQGLNEAEARGLLQGAGPLFTEAAYAAAERGDAKQALALLEEGKARLLAVALKLERLNLNPSDRRRLDELRRQIREGEAAYEAAQGEEKAAKIGELIRLRGTLLQFVDVAENKLRGEADRDIVAAVNQVLPEGGALVAPIVGEGGGKLILAVRGQGGTRLDVVNLPQLTRARLEELLGARDRGGWLGAYSNKFPDPAKQDAKKPDTKTQAERHEEWMRAIESVGVEFGKLFGGPLADALAAKGLTPGSGAPVIILPVGPLGLLPLGLARLPSTGSHLAENYTVAFAPSLEALASARSRANAEKGEPSLAAIVNPTGDLRFTTLESALVASRFVTGRKLALAGGAATSKAVLSAIKGREYWHFSSHGLFDWDDPRNSGLLMSNAQRLTVGELMDAGGLGSPRLAVLSACETGLYDIATTPNEFTGLPAAFLKLGAGGVLATLWPIDDFSTALLIARFYDLHRGQKLAPAAALRQAQHWLRNASAQDIRSYVASAVADGRIAEALLNSIEGSVRLAVRGQEPVGSMSDAGGKNARAASNKAQKPQDAAVDPPFAHPYYWGGFALTGF